MVPIEAIRAKLSLTQKQLADICGKSQATISRWERGELEPDAADMRAILAAAAEREAGITPADLFPTAPSEAA